MNIVGLDLSLTGTGVAVGQTIDVVRSRRRGVERLIQLRDTILEACTDADLVVIEDYAFSRAMAHSHELGELGGVARVALYEHDIPFVAVLPNVAKKFATGKGNANKNAMTAAAVRAGAGAEVDSDDNAADAWWLRQLGLYHYDQADVPVTAYRDEAADKVAWPSIERGAAA